MEIRDFNLIVLRNYAKNKKEDIGIMFLVLKLLVKDAVEVINLMILSNLNIRIY